MILPLLIGILLGAFVLIFTFQNIAAVSVVFLGWHFDGSLALILIIALAAGMILSWLFTIPERISKWSQISRLRNEANKFKEETEKLKEKVVEKDIEVSEEKGKLAATNAYIDGIDTHN